ncbi:TetR/AcrR family transcriptional regulator [Mesorhizobium sp. BR1-1-16]|uniref:TetR/AcrR family transcriptional regulator n=1 Tax=Mesorhizobium sp. BR1-1-16 TaxID=2876653 RepID=UPI001CCBD57F|nr:TetR/AcrR family transcriptional regulator [Mesorhizobium sp. BR1-1-16]MBZ9937662.1 TetR/AcrR family transcriptional regulator [Mesorhizobium sp. BR1-1-16]
MKARRAPSSEDAAADIDCAGTTPPLYGHCAKRQSIIEAAEDAFASDGFAGASIDAIALVAGVARQTVYNHYRDKETLFAAVVAAMAERANAGFYRTLASFPDQPDDLAAALSAFAERLIRNCLCNRDCDALRRLVERDGERHPALFATWRSEGPDRLAALIGDRLKGLAQEGRLELDLPERAARQFIALIHADISGTAKAGGTATDADIASAAANGVATFLRAFGTAKI